jgi:ribosomal protein L37AE/L43A
MVVYVRCPYCGKLDSTENTFLYEHLGSSIYECQECKKKFTGTQAKRNDWVVKED